jgi:selenocysteine lyase/cysteine desulfurase
VTTHLSADPDPTGPAATDQDALDLRGQPRPSSSGRPADQGFARVPGYLNAATLGLPPRATVTAVSAALADWQAGRGCPEVYGEAVTRSRELFAGLVGVPAAAVAVGSQASVTVGLVAAALPDGARVVCVAGDFSSMVFPFQVQGHRGVTVRHVPLDGLADAVDDGCDLVAYSLVQSCDGRVADAAAVRAAAARRGALTLCDTTQAVGWLDVDAAADDVTVCSAYKWLCSPRGSVFSTFSQRAREELRPVNAGWYAGASVWDSCYGPQMDLAGDARRFDVSPAWLSWVGTVPSLELFAGLPAGLARSHGAGLAGQLRERLDLAPSSIPVVALPDPDGGRAARLKAAGCVVASRAGRVRLAFHLWNDQDDVCRAAEALNG